MGAIPKYEALFELSKLTDVALGRLLDCLTLIDQDLLSTYPAIPNLYESGVVYYHDGVTDDPWADTLRVLARGHGDCEDLACWRAAELRVRKGINAWPTFTRKVKANGKQLVHIFVRLPGGQFEDPSRILGMK